MATKLKQFEITARLVLMASVTINAESFEDALAQSKDMRETDFVKFKGDFIDGSISVGGVSKSGHYDTEQEE